MWPTWNTAAFRAHGTYETTTKLPLGSTRPPVPCAMHQRPSPRHRERRDHRGLLPELPPPTSRWSRSEASRQGELGVNRARAITRCTVSRCTSARTFRQEGHRRGHAFTNRFARDPSGAWPPRSTGRRGAADDDSIPPDASLQGAPRGPVAAGPWCRRKHSCRQKEPRCPRSPPQRTLRFPAPTPGEDRPRMSLLDTCASACTSR